MIANIMGRFVRRAAADPHNTALREQRGMGTPLSSAVFHAPQAPAPAAPLQTMNVEVIYDPRFAALEDEVVINIANGDYIANR